MYRGRLQKDFDLWVQKGLIGRLQADQLLAEYDGRRESFSIGTVLAILAAVLLSASLLMLIASGWEEIPRLGKIGGVFALIWMFHLAAALALRRGASRIAAGLLILGSASFGGGIALVGQQYHLSGDTVDAMLLWFALTALSAAAFRSGALTAMAGLLTWVAFASFLDQMDARWDDAYVAAILCAAAVVAILSWWTQAAAMHFVYLLLLAFAVWFYSLSNVATTTAMAMVLVGLVCFFATTLKAVPSWSKIMQGIGTAPAFYALSLALIGLGLLHIDYDSGLRLAVLSSLTLAVCILALWLAGRDNGAVRVIAYGAFAAEVLYLSFVTIDSMLGTSGFFLLSGFVVAILAFAVVRVEKMFAARAKARGVQ
ncbi:DUF2157 domain-containing protein [Rhizobium sp. RU36D]|uniref:DUF2157 domain-containing protein n=1 Tax=Rhizobium sp. RU36D TaxID=1907415 RepID=UPI0009D8DC11|nr:DUF2157 domain-containing protein [Rhizobium sp. RU36D]SMC64922.1 Uncharacterized membrane protein [Rhizobium sp. RU36D]